MNSPVACALLLLVLAGCGAASSSAREAAPDAGPDAGTDAGPLAAGLTISGDSAEGLGIFDPSVVYAAGASAGSLVYSVVDPDQLHVHTRLASSTDQGRSWSYVATVNQAAAASVGTTDASVCGKPSCTGMIIHEVPSLVVDPDDSADRLFKVFNHSYFANAAAGGAAGLHPDIGVVTLYTAPAPAGPWTETPLLGWNGSSPFSAQGVQQNAATDPALAGLRHCVALTEPGALLHGGVLELALGCVFSSGGPPQIEIDLLRSADHGRSFSFVATLLSAADAFALGSPSGQINAPDLFQIGGRTFLFATPGGTVQFPGGGTGAGYRGCLAVEVTDLAAGLIARSGGAPVVTASYTGSAGQFVGACTAAEGAAALGVAGDVLSPTPPLFGIFATGRPAP